jgi:hypothetical protein
LFWSAIVSPEAPRTPAAQSSPEFAIDDAKSFDENLTGFLNSLIADHPVLGPVMRRELPRLINGEITQGDLLNALKHALEEQGG